jgi:hypothetical protein
MVTAGATETESSLALSDTTTPSPGAGPLSSAVPRTDPPALTAPGEMSTLATLGGCGGRDAGVGLNGVSTGEFNTPTC